MASPATAARFSEKLGKTASLNLAPTRNVRALVVSSEFEVRKPLLYSLESLHVDTIVCAGRTEAEDVLAKESVDIVFCDDHLPDGSYSDLVHPSHYEGKIPRVVVTTRTGDWDLYFDALGKGAFDVIQCPCYARDVEMAVGRVLREEDSQSLMASS